MMRMFTGRYQDKKIPQYNVVPVGITLGRPKFSTGYEYEYLRLLAPTRDMWGKSHEEFARLYMTRLDNIGFERIDRELTAISKRHDGKDLMLLCFENVLKGEYCHRRVFADWWKEETGEYIPEMGEDAEKPEDSLISLF